MTAVLTIRMIIATFIFHIQPQGILPINANMVGT